MITVRDVLTHTAGFTNSIAATKAYRGAMAPIELSKKELISKLSQILKYQPELNGRLIHRLVGHLVEVILGKSRQFLKERLFEPLIMPDSHFYLTKEKLIV